MATVGSIPRFRTAMFPQLLVLVVEPDSVIAGAIEEAMSVCGHEVVHVPAASWAVPIVCTRDPPDVVLVDRGAAGYDRLRDVLDALPVEVPVVETTFGPSRQSLRFLDETQATALVRLVEQAVWP